MSPCQIRTGARARSDSQARPRWPSCPMMPCSRPCSGRLSAFSGRARIPAAAWRATGMPGARAPTRRIWWRPAARASASWRIIVAVERGWIAREAALERLGQHARSADARDLLSRRLCRTFSTAAPARPFPSCRKDDGGDLVETSLSVHGTAVRAAVFSPRQLAAEAACVSRSRLWDEVEWNWYTRGGRERALLALESQHWLGDGSRDPRLERVPDHLRAGRQPRRATPSIRSVYHRGFAGGRDFSMAASTTASSCRSACPMAVRCSLRTIPSVASTRAACSDRYADYWQQNVRHVRINRAHCIANPNGHKGLWRGLLGPDRERRSDAATLAHAPDQRQRHASRRPRRCRACPMRRGSRWRRCATSSRGTASASGDAMDFVDAFCEQRDWYAQHLPGDRPGSDRRDDREPSQRPAVAAVHERRRKCVPACGGSASPARCLHQRAPDAVAPGAESSHGSICSTRAPAAGMLRSISPVGIVKTRPGFGQTIRPQRGSIVASPVLAGYDPDPDYFFHWFRDSAVVIDALRLLHAAGPAGRAGLAHLHDFVDFSLALGALDGRSAGSSPAVWRPRWRPTSSSSCARMPSLRRARRRRRGRDPRQCRRHARYLELGPAAARWPGAARADAAALDAARRGGARAAEPAADAAACGPGVHARHWREPCYDIWEEENGLHYYTLRVSAAALADGRGTGLQAQEQQALAQRYAARGACSYARALDDFWDAEPATCARACVEQVAGISMRPTELDIAVMLAAIHAGGEGAHSRARSAPAGHAGAVGDRCSMRPTRSIMAARRARHRPWAATRGMSIIPAVRTISRLWGLRILLPGRGVGPRRGQDWFRRGDAFLETVRAYTPENGRHVGAVRSADRRADLGQASGLELRLLHLHDRGAWRRRRPGASGLRRNGAVAASRFRRRRIHQRRTDPAGSA